MSNVVSKEVLEVAAGDTITSFDDLEAVQNPKEQESRVQLTEEENIDATKELDEEVEELAKEDPKEAEAKTDEAEEVESEVLKSYYKDEELELKADTQVEVKINGEMKKVSIKDLRDNYSGETHFKEKFDGLNHERQGFEKKQAEVQGFINEIHDNFMVKKDMMGGLYSLTEAMGGDPMKVISEVQQELLQKAVELSELSEEERTHKLTQDRIALMENQNARQQQTRTSRQETAQMEKRVDAVLLDKKMDNRAFVETYNELSKTVNIDDLTPEQVGEHYSKLAVAREIGVLLDDINPDLGEGKQSAQEELSQVFNSNDGLTIEDLREIAIEVYGSDVSKTLSKKLNKTKPVGTKNTSGGSGKELTSFDDI